jgi:hypothetical protein
MSILKLSGGVVLGVALGMAGHDATAEPNLSPPHITAPSAANRNFEALTTQMTQRYGLTSDQAAKVRTILEEQARRFEQVANQGLPPQDGFSRLKSLEDEEISRISAVLTSEQRRKYELEDRSALTAAPPPGSR